MEFGASPPLSVWPLSALRLSSKQSLTSRLAATVGGHRDRCHLRADNFPSWSGSTDDSPRPSTERRRHSAGRAAGVRLGPATPGPLRPLPLSVLLRPSRRIPVPLHVQARHP